MAPVSLGPDVRPAMPAGDIPPPRRAFHPGDRQRLSRSGFTPTTSPHTVLSTVT